MAAIAHPPEATLRKLRPPGPRIPVGVGVVAALAVLARLPLIGAPVTPDEGGLLLLAGQWQPGTSLYGDYWVDRPPLLIDLYAIAAHSGGLVALRIGGCLLVFGAVLLAGLIGSEVARCLGAEPLERRTSLIGAATAAIFLVNPLFSAYAVDGELIATLPILGAIWLTLRSVGNVDRLNRLALFVTAGACAAASVLIKQNEIDALVFLAAFAILGRATHLVSRRDMAAVVGGGLGLTVIVLAHAASRGTDPAGLWDAIVTFRVQAGNLIRTSASSATTTRTHHLLAALVMSGLPLIVAVAVVQSRWLLKGSATARAILGSGLAMLGWEAISVAAGGSYWLHYLLCFVPGAVLLASVGYAAKAGTRDGSRELVRPTLAYAAVASLIAILVVATHADRLDPDAGTAAWLASHRRPGDTAVVLYGHANILFGSGMSSPYSELWSLPIRVRDPELTEFSESLTSEHPPTYVVTPLTGLGTWGVDSIRTQRTLEHLYAPVEEIDGHTIYGLRANLESTGVHH